MSPAKNTDSKTIATNRATRFHYEIMGELVAGLVLTGPEVKSCRVNSINLRGAYISVDAAGEAWLRGVDIPEYKLATDQPHDRHRHRKLLLSSKELAQLAGQLKEKGIAAFPLNLHFGHGRIKCRIGIGRGKKQWDKRETIKKRDLERESRRRIH